MWRGKRRSASGWRRGEPRMIHPGTDDQAVALAAQRLREGGLIGLPTETVYGLGADANHPAAVAQVFALKGRPSDHPLIVHVLSIDQVAWFAADVPDFARRLMDAFWPGPLTLILPRRAGVAEHAAGGQATVGVRCPSHPVARAVLRQALNLGVIGVAAPSANRFGRVSPTTANHVTQELGDDLLVLDGGACAVGIESTIIDCSRGAPVLLRPGMLALEALSAAAGQTVWPQCASDESGVQDALGAAGAHLTPPALTDDGHPAFAGTGLAAPAPKASGTLAAHYAPHATVRLLSTAHMQARLDAGHWPRGSGVAIWSHQPVHGPGIQHHPMPQSAAQAAQMLFAWMRQCDDAGVSEIWVENPPPGPDWDGVRDRLQRAAAAAQAGASDLPQYR
jgi:L-threonylcarbamoyladenylate synthase